MKNKSIVIYSDASFSKEHKLAVIGFTKGSSESKVEDLELTLKTIKEENNVRAELRAAILGLASCPEDSSVTLFSDSSAVVDLIKRRENLEKNEFVSKKTGVVLSNADLYQKFYFILDKLNVEVHWIKGHSPKKSLGNTGSNFSHLDKSVRKELRLKVKQISK